MNYMSEAEGPSYMPNCQMTQGNLMLCWVQLGKKRIEQNAILEVKLPLLQAVTVGHV